MINTILHNVFQDLIKLYPVILETVRNFFIQSATVRPSKFRNRFVLSWTYVISTKKCGRTATREENRGEEFCKASPDKSLGHWVAKPSI